MCFHLGLPTSMLAWNMSCSRSLEILQWYRKEFGKLPPPEVLCTKSMEDHRKKLGLFEVNMTFSHCPIHVFSIKSAMIGSQKVVHVLWETSGASLINSSWRGATSLRSEVTCIFSVSWLHASTGWQSLVIVELKCLEIIPYIKWILRYIWLPCFVLGFFLVVGTIK